MQEEVLAKTLKSWNSCFSESINISTKYLREKANKLKTAKKYRLSHINCPISSFVSVGRSVGWSVCHNSPKGGKLHLRDIVILLAFVQKSFHLKKKRKKNLFLSSRKALSMPGLQVFFQQKNPKEAKVLKVFFLRTFNEKKLMIKDNLELILY